MLSFSTTKILDIKEVRYLLVGGGNTLFGYVVATGLYYRLSYSVPIIVIGILANILSISVSFSTYKVFVFRTQGNWLNEYLKCYVVYGGSAVLNIAGLWVLVDAAHVAFWLAQGALMAAGVIISYTGHAMFTFKGKGP